MLKFVCRDQLCKVLKSLDHKVWMDETDLNAGSSPLTAELPINLFLQELLLRLSKWQDLARACKLDE